MQVVLKVQLIIFILIIFIRADVIHIYIYTHKYIAKNEIAIERTSSNNFQVCEAEKVIIYKGIIYKNDMDKDVDVFEQKSSVNGMS